MALVSGKALDGIVAELVEWVVTTTDYLREQLTQDYPFGSAPVSEVEQLMQYRAMTEDSWAMLVAQLEEQYRGQSNMRRRVQSELDTYHAAMGRLEAKMAGEGSANLV